MTQAEPTVTRAQEDARLIAELQAKVDEQLERQIKNVVVGVDVMQALLNENERMREQVKDLQETGGRVLNVNRRLKAESRHERVKAFHRRFGHPVGDRPRVPDDAQVRFRLSLITEEFLELLEASGIGYVTCGPGSDWDVFEELRNAIKTKPIKVDLPAFVDAQEDLDYVNEGTRIVFGVDGGPIAEAVQNANMAKDPAYVLAKDNHHRAGKFVELGDNKQLDPKAKPTKPLGWKPPDVHALLDAQGWVIQREEDVPPHPYF